VCSSFCSLFRRPVSHTHFSSVLPIRGGGSIPFEIVLSSCVGFFIARCCQKNGFFMRCLLFDQIMSAAAAADGGMRRGLCESDGNSILAQRHSSRINYLVELSLLRCLQPKWRIFHDMRVISDYYVWLH
jgi:hypothetical protein